MARSRWLAAIAASVSGLYADDAAVPDVRAPDAQGLDAPAPDAQGLDAPAPDANDGGSLEAADGPAVCDADLSSDPQSCGRCAHDCLGGVCEGGRCQPTTLVQIRFSRGVASDDSYVYVLAQNGITRIDKATNLEKGVIVNDPLAQALAVDDASVYWLDEVDAGTDDAGAALGVTINSAAKDGGGAMQLAFDPIHQYYIMGIAASGGVLYWTDPGTGTYPTPDGRIRTCALHACAAPSTFADQVAQPIAIAADGPVVAWVGTSPGTSLNAMTLCAADGGCGPIASPLPDLAPVALSTGTVFVAQSSPDGGRLFSCPVSGCGTSPTELAHDLNWQNLLGIAADPAAIYFVDFYTGYLYRLAR
jgi:hypothetical protein